MNKSILIKLGAVAVVILAAYFINVEIQSKLGQAAVDATGLEPLVLQDAIAKAKDEKKLVLADLSAIWCPSCRKLDKVVLSDENVKTLINDKFVFSRIEFESDEGAAFMETYKVKGFPTLVVIDPNTKAGKKLPLSFSPEAFTKTLAAEI